jgi:hypothetical protein
MKIRGASNRVDPSDRCRSRLYRHPRLFKNHAIPQAPYNTKTQPVPIRIIISEP